MSRPSDMGSAPDPKIGLQVQRSSPSRLIGAVSMITTLAEGRVGVRLVQMAVITVAHNAQMILSDSNIDPELLFTTTPGD